MQATPKITILDTTESVCPVCLKVVKATVVARGKAVYMEKGCPEHGSVTTYLWPDVDHYRWIKGLSFPYSPPKTPVKTGQGCPRDCGLCKNHLRHSTLVEIEVTERCNLRCPVCFMAAGAARNAFKADPGIQALGDKYRTIVEKAGPQTSVQLTGGEPTIRRDLPEIIRLGLNMGLTAIEINTNGVVIANDYTFLKELVRAGASGIYLQFDGITSDVYKKIRGEDLLSVKLQAIENCRRAGIQVVLAMTVIEGINHCQLGQVLEFALQNKDVIAGIAYQPAFGSGRFDIAVNKRLTMGDVIFMLAEQSQGLLEPYDFWPLGCSHPLCSSAVYLVEEEGKIAPLNRRLTLEDYLAEFDPQSPQGSVLGDIAYKKFPHLQAGLSIVIMNYMDAFTMDLKRLRECSMTVLDKDGGIVPFCSYQLTNTDGRRKDEISVPNTNLRGNCHV
ncbi:MAG: radical SAM protein [Peptococcaceae bacterium]|nr:radical SAM protein [Peptococcaceae bacterium]